MSNLDVQRFEHGRPMLLAGIRRTHSFASMAADIPAQWHEFEKLGELPGQVGAIAYGAICGGDPKAQTMEYLCGVEVASFDGLPPALGRMRVPAGFYAVFWHGGEIAGVQATWREIFAWLPNSGFESANAPDFERYDERFDPKTGQGGVEIWLAVRRPE